MLNGKVIEYDQQSGRGKLTSESDGELTFNARGIEGNARHRLAPNKAVHFVVVAGSHGPQAAHVRLVEEEA